MIENLTQTKTLMESKDYKDRFIAEYWQTKIRYEKLKAFCNKLEASTYSMNVEAPKHDCVFGLLKEQESVMGEYLHILEIRAVVENIELDYHEKTEGGKC